MDDIQRPPVDGQVVKCHAGGISQTAQEDTGRAVAADAGAEVDLVGVERSVGDAEGAGAGAGGGDAGIADAQITGEIELAAGEGEAGGGAIGGGDGQGARAGGGSTQMVNVPPLIWVPSAMVELPLTARLPLPVDAPPRATPPVPLTVPLML